MCSPSKFDAGRRGGRITWAPTTVVTDGLTGCAPTGDTGNVSTVPREPILSIGVTVSGPLTELVAQVGVNRTSVARRRHTLPLRNSSNFIFHDQFHMKNS